MRQTGYLTKSNDAHLQRLLKQQYILSLTRFLTEAVEKALKEKFDLTPE